MKKSLIALAISSVGAANFALASETDEQNLETITVTATRGTDTIGKPLASQIVIDRADIELAQVESLPELLSRYAGIDIAQNGARGQAASVFIRGASSDQTLVLVNGLRVNSATLGSATWSTISPMLIERIEIVKGPRAAVWGSDAIGGVINIITREQRAGTIDLSARWGTNNTLSVFAGAGIKHGDGSTSFSVNHESSDGFDVFKTHEPDEDGYDNLSFSINGNQKISDDLSVSWMLRSSDQESDYDNDFFPGAQMVAENENREWQLAAEYDWGISSQNGATKNNTTQFVLGSTKDSSFNVNENTPEFPGSLFETRRDQFSVINTTRFNDYFSLVLGSDIYDEEVDSTTIFAVQDRRVEGYFGHGLYESGDLSAELALRYDDVEGVDSETTYNASIGYRVTDTVRVSYLRGTGFKAPTFNDLYFPFGGNPDLVSETSDTNEIVVSYSTDDISVDVSWFQNDIENLIEWAEVSPGTFQPTNIAVAEIEGVDFTAVYTGFGGTHTFNLGYLDAVDGNTGVRLARRAKNQHSYQFMANFGATDLLFNYEYKGRRFDRGVELASYKVVDITVDHDFTSEFSGVVKVQNFFNEEYETVLNYNVIGRAIYFGVNYQL